MRGGLLRVPYHGAVPISPNSDMTARLHSVLQSSILDWAQSQHQSAASGTKVDSTRSRYRPCGQCPLLGENVWVLFNRSIRVLI